MKIPFVDLKSQYLSIQSEIDKAISAVISETAFIGGKYVEQFKKDFEASYGVKHCIPVANGTDAIYITMKILGIGTGDEVITTASSWISTSETISQTGAKPVFVDIDPVYYTIDVLQIEKFITPATKAIIPVHLYGQMADLQSIKNLCQKYNLFLIEDCAQSHYSELNGIRAGLEGIASTFSFYPGKNLGAYGDAGCIITNSDELAVKMTMYSNHGALKKHQHQIEGINSRLDGIQAAILSSKLPHILEWTQKRITNAALYDFYFQGINEIVIPKVRPESKHTFHLYVIRAKNRDALMSFLNGRGIETAIHYPRALPNLPAYANLNIKNTDFPVASDYQNKILSLPMYPELEENQIKYICQTVREFYLKRN